MFYMFSKRCINLITQELSLLQLTLDRSYLYSLMSSGAWPVNKARTGIVCICSWISLYTTWGAWQGEISSDSFHSSIQIRNQKTFNYNFFDIAYSIIFHGSIKSRQAWFLIKEKHFKGDLHKIYFLAPHWIYAAWFIHMPF